MISVQGLEKHYGGQPVLTGVDVEFSSQAVTFLAGANGAGKTTFFKCLLGLERSSGTVRFDGSRLEDVRDDVVAIFDDTPFYPHLSGAQNLTIALGDVDVDRAAEFLGGHRPAALLHRKVRSYSSGERKRLGLAWACLARPRYVLLDEIASGLDLESMDLAQERIAALAQHATVIVTGHQFSFYERVLDHAVVLVSGKVWSVDGDAHVVSGDLERAYRELVAGAES